MTYRAKLNQLEDLTSELDHVIERTAREVATARKVTLDFNPGTRYSRPLYFSSYERTEMDEDSGNTRYYGVDYPIAYPLGTELINVKFEQYVGDGTEQMYVAFPESYLDNPKWIEEEQPYIDAKARRDEEKRLSSMERERLRIMDEINKLQSMLGDK